MLNFIKKKIGRLSSFQAPSNVFDNGNSTKDFDINLFLERNASERKMFSLCTVFIEYLGFVNYVFMGILCPRKPPFDGNFVVKTTRSVNYNHCWRKIEEVYFK